MAVPITTIDQNGVLTPLFTDVLVYLQEQYQAIYGTDVNLDADTQDGQWVAVIATAINDCNQTIAATYQAYSPTYAQGAGLSSVVKINGVRRLRASTSTVVLRCVGIAGRQIGGTTVGDNLNLQSQWVLPPDVVIPPEGEISVTATCNVLGAVAADTDTLTEILTPVPGWQTVTNPAPAAIGLPIENDAQLRRRQTQSVANPSQTVVVGIQGSIANLQGVERVMVYENPTSVATAEGIPPYAMAAVVQGGDSQEIANAIALRKTPGSPTFGTTHILVFDSRGIPATINYFQLAMVPITVQITLTALPGFTSTIEQEIIDQVVQYLTELPIGYDSYLTKLIAATQVAEPDGLTYDVTSVKQARGSNTPTAADVTVIYIEAVTSDATLVTVTVV